MKSIMLIYYLNVNYLRVFYLIKIKRYFSDRDLLNRVPKIFLIMSGICLCFQIIGCLLMFERNEPSKRILIHNSINDDEQDAEKTELIYTKKINSLGLK